MEVFPIHHHLMKNRHSDPLDGWMLVPFGGQYSHGEYPNHQRLNHDLVLPLDDLEWLAIQLLVLNQIHGQMEQLVVVVHEDLFCKVDDLLAMKQSH